MTDKSHYPLRDVDNSYYPRETEIPDGATLLYPGQIAKLLNVSPAKVRRWLNKGILPSQQDARYGWRSVKAADLAAFAEERELELDWEAIL